MVLKLKLQALDLTFYRFLGEDMSMNYRVECHVFLIDMSSTICVRKGKREKKKRSKGQRAI